MFLLNPMASISFCRGDSVAQSYNFSSPTYSFSLATSGLTVAPAIGDSYIQGTILLYVTNVSGSVVTLVSGETTNSLTATGTITKVTGTGDTTITYTSKTASLATNLTGATVKFIILKNLVNEPSSGEILLPAKTLTIANATGGIASLYLTPTETLSLAVGSYYGVFQISFGSTIVNEQLDSQYVVINVNKQKLV